MRLFVRLILMMDTFYLMPGESKEVCFQVDCKERVDKLLLRVDGYNVELKDILFE